MSNTKKIAIIGGGAAGFFAAINLAEKHSDLDITIYEKSNKLLSKVKVSGGGRCNVTHNCFDPQKLISYYPRGGEKLLPAFQKFQPNDTVKWFEERGVKIKTENDNRMFPVTNNSQTIIDCFLQQAEKFGVKIKTSTGLISLEKNQKWKAYFSDESFENFDIIMIAAGSSDSVWNIVKNLNHTIVPPVPSLFTFNIKDDRLDNLPGLSFPEVKLQIEGGKAITNGPLLITHWGLSGPAVLKLSAWEALIMHEKNYQVTLQVNFTGVDKHEVRKKLALLRDAEAKKLLGSTPQFSIPSRFWKQITSILKLDDRKWAGLGNKELDLLAEEFCNAKFQVNGKSTFKEEFVTCGGVSLDEVNMETFESKIHSGLFFGGEILNIDAVTGGFNFQAAWTAGWLVSESI